MRRRSLPAPFITSNRQATTRAYDNFFETKKIALPEPISWGGIRSLPGHFPHCDGISMTHGANMAAS